VILVLVVIGLAVVVGFIAGGSLRPFEKLKLHWWGAALVGLALQGIPSASGVTESIGWALLIASYGALIAFAWINRRLPAVWLVIAGLALNVLVIGVNGGMPVSASALETAGTPADGLVGAGTVKHHLMGPEDVLTPLADVIGIPPPIGAVISIGDVLLYAGLAVLVVMVMLGRSGENHRPPARLFQGYRGKHLPPQERRFSRSSAVPPALPRRAPPGAARWGTAP
jgi:hypothetical protein